MEINKEFYKKETLIAMVERLMPSEIYNLCVVADGILTADKKKWEDFETRYAKEIEQYERERKERIQAKRRATIAAKKTSAK